ncbi:sensor histidine kinase [Muricoccus nepalensis]|uniref:sensor histidine kinase n=1 Tax=Muricoccus nepalensis TaxID=1854500 RepID=UPI001387252C|nr:sensor histidine kinase [Roseomonas nepalensis]
MSISKQPRNRKGQTAAERNLRDIKARNGPFVAAVEATRVPMVVTDPQVVGNPIIYVNDAFLRLCGHDREDVLGQGYFFLVGEHADPGIVGRFAAAMATSHPFKEDVPFRAKDGREVWVSMFVSPVMEGERVVQHFASFLDITDRIERERELLKDKETLDRRVAARTKRLQQVNAKLEEEVERRRRTEAILRDALAQGQEDLRYRDFLIREVNHRTKNAIQLAISLLTIQARQFEDTACRGALDVAAGRLQRIGGVYALLTYQGDNLERVDFPDYLRRLCGELAQSLEPSAGQVRIEVEAEEEGSWSPDLVVPLGLIVGEAVTNALKHAFPEGRKGRIQVELRAQSDGLMQLRVEDDGVGMPPERRKNSLGLRLIEMFAQQVKGKALMEGGPNGGGVVVEVTFPNPNTAPGLKA